MSPLEQEALLLRQLVGLRRRGLAHDQALKLAAESLPQGALRARVDHALRVLAAGTAPAKDGLAFDGLLEDGACSLEQLESAAEALEARLWARVSLRTARLYLRVALVGPPLLACMLGWLLWPSLADALPAVSPALLGLVGLARYAGLPLAGGALYLVQRLDRRLAPGFGKSMQAVALLEVAARGGDEPAVALRAEDRSYFLARRARVGSTEAARELAAELALESRRSLRVFHHLAPVLAAVLAFPALGLVMVLLMQPLFSLHQSLGY